MAPVARSVKPQYLKPERESDRVVGVQCELLSSSGRFFSVFMYVVRGCLSHSALCTRTADRTWDDSISWCVCSVGRLISVPVHPFETRMSCHFVHTVIFRRGFEVCDQETTSWDESGLYVQAVDNGHTCDLLALVSKDLHGSKDSVELINSGVHPGKHDNVSDLADLRY